MQIGTEAVRAYAASAARRSLREQEAEVFRRTNSALRRGRELGGLERVRALADNQRLWSNVIDLMRDPQNMLPVSLRAAVISVGLSVQREMQCANPDTEFLLAVNENIAGGLSVDR
jgi:flagellar biosynthesis regulator FlaF